MPAIFWNMQIQHCDGHAATKPVIHWMSTKCVGCSFDCCNREVNRVLAMIRYHESVPHQSWSREYPQSRLGFLGFVDQFSIR